jgi:uncharacterized protein with HEPN domain
MRDNSERTLDMLDAIERIERYALKGREAFVNDELIQTWIIHHLQIIGEAASKVDQGFRELHPEVMWPQIVAMRNVIAHEYFGIDLDEVWQVIEKDLPELKEKLLGICFKLNLSVYP